MPPPRARTAQEAPASSQPSVITRQSGESKGRIRYLHVDSFPHAPAEKRIVLKPAAVEKPAREQGAPKADQSSTGAHSESSGATPKTAPSLPALSTATRIGDLRAASKCARDTEPEWSLLGGPAEVWVAGCLANQREGGVMGLYAPGMRSLRSSLAAVLLCSGLAAAVAMPAHAGDNTSAMGVRFVLEPGQNADLTSSDLTFSAGVTATKVVNGKTVREVPLRAMLVHVAKLKAQGRGAVGRVISDGKVFAIVGTPDLRSDGTVRMRIKPLDGVGSPRVSRSGATSVQYTSCPSGTTYLGTDISYGDDGSAFEVTECMSNQGILIINTYIPPPA